MSWPYVRKHVLRTALTAAGIALGVAVLVGMRTANRSVLLAFSQTVDRIAGKTELQVTSGEAGFGEDVLERVQAARSVRTAVPVIEAIVDSNLPGQGQLLVLGIDMTGDRELRDYDFDDGNDAVVDDPLVFLAQPDSLILSSVFAAKNHIAAGSRLQLGTADGPKTFTVRGIVKPSALASAFGGNLAIMDIYAAQKMFGRGRTFDRIDLAVKPGSTLVACEQELHALLGPGFDVQPPSARGQQFEAMLATYSMMVSISSAFALFIGMFIIYNSFAIAVTQRRSEIGILRALGATRRQISGLFLWESAMIGAVGSGIGLILGLVIARAIAALIGSLIGNVFGVAQHVDDLATSPGLLLVAFVAGVATSVIAAAIPARRAAHLDPVYALQKGKYQMMSAGEGRFRAVAAAVLAVISVACVMNKSSRPVFYAGFVAAIVTALLLTPLLTLQIVKMTRPLLQWLRPVEGALAADGLIQAPRRTSGSVAALMLSLSLVVAFSGMARANYASILDWVDTVLNPDLFVLPSPTVDVRTTRFPPEMAPEIAAVPGVERVQLLRNGRITFRNSPAMVLAMEMSSIAQTVRRQPVAGNAEEMYRKASAGEGVLASDNFAQLQHLTLGDVIEIVAPYGTIRLPIVGIIVDYTDQQGTILMDRSLYMKYWHDDSVNMFRVYVKGDAVVGDVRQRILDRYANRRQVFVLTNNDLKSYIVKVASQWFGLTSVQVAFAVLVAVLGIVNTLTVSITDRRRELGVLRALGAGRGQIRRTIWIEALAVATLGLILGCVLGAVNLYYILQIAQKDIAGVRLDYAFPFPTALTLVPIMLSVGFVAALWPAQVAVRGSLVEALEYE
jgi:putative ABC transport system permease protein